MDHSQNQTKSMKSNYKDEFYLIESCKEFEWEYIQKMLPDLQARNMIETSSCVVLNVNTEIGFSHKTEFSQCSLQFVVLKELNVIQKHFLLKDMVRKEPVSTKIFMFMRSRTRGS